MMLLRQLPQLPAHLPTYMGAHLTFPGAGRQIGRSERSSGIGLVPGKATSSVCSSLSAVLPPGPLCLCSQPHLAPFRTPAVEKNKEEDGAGLHQGGPAQGGSSTLLCSLASPSRLLIQHSSRYLLSTLWEEWSGEDRQQALFQNPGLERGHGVHFIPERTQADWYWINPIS